MKLGWRFLTLPLVLFYLLTPVALVFAQNTATSSTSTPHYAPPACQLRVNPSNISVGGSVTLSWQSQNAAGGTITGVGGVGPSGSINLLPSSAAQTVFVGTFTGLGGTGTCQAVVTVSSGSYGGGGSTPQPTPGPPLNITPTIMPTPPASNGGLVPCGLGGFVGSSNGQGGTSGNDQNAATGCQACNLAQLISLIINFCIGLSIPIAALLFAYAGGLYFTSGANPANKDKAKAIFKNAFVGFLIAITAWLVVNTLLHALLDGGRLFTGGNWFTIQCTQQNRPVNTNISQVLSSLPIVGGSGGNSLTPTGGGSGSSCPSGYDLQPGGYCYNSVSNDIVSPISGSSGGGGPSSGTINSDTGAYSNNSAAGPLGTCSSGYDYYTGTGPDSNTAGCINPTTGDYASPKPYSSINPDVTTGVKSLDDLAFPTSAGYCATNIRQSLVDMGYDNFETNFPPNAYQYGKYLTNDGWTSVAENSISGYSPNVGDIAVFQPIPGHDSGHIEMWDGTQWVSDFKQNSFYANSGYKNSNYTVYRHG